MPMKIRGYRQEDREILYDICLQTGAAGKDATASFGNPELLGDIYVGPYLRFASQMIFVAEDKEGVAGYIVGVLDSEDWSNRLDQDWWPALRAQYPLDPLEKVDGLNQTAADRDCINAIHNPQQAPPELVARYPAHIHMNLLPRLQGRGVGGIILKRWFDIAVNHGVSSVHIGVSAHNRGGIAFWQKHRFETIDTNDKDEGTLWMGRDLP